MRSQVLAFCLLLLLLPSALALCSPLDPLRIAVTPSSGAVALGETVQGDVLYEPVDGLVLGVSSLDDVDGLVIENTTFTFTPVNTSRNISRFLFYLVTPDGCVATALATFDVLLPPEIQNITPADQLVRLQEGRARLFSAAVEQEYATWFFDGEENLTGNSSFLFYPDYTMAGNHSLELVVTNRYGLTSSWLWKLTVLNVNRPPVQIVDIVGFALQRGELLEANLSSYFIDPDGSDLSFSADVQVPSIVDAGEIEVSFEGERVFITGIDTGKVFLSFTATDNAGAALTSESVMFRIVDAVKEFNPFCGDGSCIAPENCTACQRDCGECLATPCVPEWVCSDWSACYPGDYQNRTCVVANGCDLIEEEPVKTRVCEYVPQCDDGLRNGDEQGVDCGGSCPACPSCSDGVMNQGEEGVDCGGPCSPCPTCTDGLRNQDESDVDCGGVCARCDLGAACRGPLDCLSFSCVEATCRAASCNDSVRNQDEERIDCGGPCSPCPTCTDGLRNQDEEKIDCGGSCDPCPSCDDGIVNQEERFVDCGGPCRECVFHDYTPLILVWFGWLGLVFGVLFLLYVLRSLLASRMLFLFNHGKAIHFFYEDPLTYNLLRFWNAIIRHFRIERQKELHDMVEQAYHEIVAMKYKVPENSLRLALTGKLRGLYASLVGLPPGFEMPMLVANVKRSALPFPVRIIILKNTKILALLEQTKLYTDPFFALDDVLRTMEHLRKAF